MILISTVTFGSWNSAFADAAVLDPILHPVDDCQHQWRELSAQRQAQSRIIAKPPNSEERRQATAFAQQRLYLRPLPQGQGSLRPTRSERGRIAASRMAVFLWLRQYLLRATTEGS